ncbi:acyl-CoA thioesterase [Anaerovorax odorimutans]|uniref:Acyl-CoA thioesterase n=2 Tax=Anaerovorax odorimutans TaxID=109327 RepID=A0ABT1RKY8_9FIRM|nr:acyl-CoA thioesterase [Anaerovorax odorimutans]
MMTKMDVRNQIVMSQVMMPHHANALGIVHGGEVMKFMDTAAAAVAMRYAKADCVTARVDEMNFHFPVHVGDLVVCTASIVYVGRTSIEVLVTVNSENLKSEENAKVALSAYFTMVCIDENGQPQQVKPYTPQTDDEKTLYERAKAYIDRKKALRK